MSQRRRSHIIVVALVLLIALVFGAAYMLQRGQIAAIEAEVSAIRGLERLGETTLRFVTRAEVSAEQDAAAEEDETRDEGERIVAFYRALDLLPPDLDLSEAFRDFYQANVVGYFDIEAAEITLLRGPGTQFAPLSFFERLTYAHEFMHVLQDQHFDLEQVWQRVGENASFDQYLAVNALIEGDAETIESEILDQQLWRMSDRELDYLIRQAERVMAAAPSSRQTPAVIQAAFSFSYDEGSKFVAGVVAKAGWERVDQAFAGDPPLSTEQIYHPERYLAGEAPIELAPADVGQIIGDGWRGRYDNAVGEFYLRQHLQTNLYATAAARAAAGWGGDRLQIYSASESGEMLWIWRQVWDSVADADEFAAEYRRFLGLRYDWAENDGRCWSRETTHCFARTGDLETRISMARDRETARRLLGLDD